MTILRSLLYPALLAIPIGAAAQSASLWHYQFNQGVGEYSTGRWDSPTGGALAISCNSDGSILIGAQIKGQPPPPNSQVTLTATSRIVARTSTFTSDGEGGIVIPSAADPAFRILWANLRWGDAIGVRYADGRALSHPLAGAARTLPVEPCE